jgi:AsmA protein
MKKWLIGIAAVIILLVVVALVLPFVIPVSAYKDRIIAAAEQATGRSFAINGAISLSILPRTAVEVSDVAFGNPKGMPGQMLTLGKLQLRVNPLALLQHKLEVDSFVLVDPKIDLVIDKEGHPNWQLAAAAPAQAAPGAPKSAVPTAPAGTAPSPAPQAASGSPLSDVRLGDIRLVNGTVSYSDLRSGKKEQIDAINLKLALPDLQTPMKASGQARWNGKGVDLTLDLAKPGAFLAGEPSAVELKLAASPVSFDFKGTIAQHPEMHLAGTTVLDIPSIKDLAAWTGAPLPPTSGGLGLFKISGTFDHQGTKTAFKGAEIALDAMKAKGDFAIDTAGVRPAFKGTLDIDRLDLNPYLPPEQPASTAPAPAKSAAPTSSPAAKPAAAAGWSDAPIDVSGLNAADAEFALTVGGIQFKKIAIGASALALHLKDARLATELSKMELYSGNGKGSVKLDGAAAVPALDAAFTLDKVQAEPLLKDAMDFDRVKGTANADIAVQSHGKSQRDLIGDLGGKGGVRFTDGSIKGIDIVGLVKNAATSLLSAGSQSNAQTDFSSLTGTFTITKGIVDNKDMALKSAVLSATGAGTVDLPQQTVNYRLAGNVAGVTVPIQVTGPWSNLSYGPDAGALLKTPGAALKGIEQTLTGPAAPSGGTQGGAPATTSKPGDLLKGLFGAPKN